RQLLALPALCRRLTLWISPPNSMYNRRLGSHQLDRSASITASVQWHCPHSNFANNLFASACDSRRPIISFATFHWRSKLVACIRKTNRSEAAPLGGLFFFSGRRKIVYWISR